MYLRLQFAVIFILIACLAGFNFLIDPYGLFFPESALPLSKNKTEFFMKEPMIKPLRVSAVRPETLILGSSAAGLGYDENHPYFRGKSVYNFSMAGASMYTIYRAFQHAMAKSELKSAFLELNLISFNEYHTFVVRNENNIVGEAFEGLIAVDEYGGQDWFGKLGSIAQIKQFLLSTQATRDSIATLKKQGPYDDWRLNSRGGWRGATLAPGQNQGSRFLNVQRYLFNGFFNDPSSVHPFSIYREDGHPSRAFDYLVRLLDDAYRNNIEMTLVFSPSHAYYYEALDYLGLGEMFIDWKRKVTRINEEVAAKNGKTPFKVWDFAYYSDLTTEPVPAVDDNATRMKFHYDPLHFTRSAGNKVFDRVYLGGEGPGFAITSENLDSVLQMQLEGKQRFHRENPALIKRLKAMFKRVSSPRQQ